ncbi:MAG: hypothetical protein ACJ8H8_04510 [Geminicoccaceae bacterium]
MPTKEDKIARLTAGLRELKDPGTLPAAEPARPAPAKESRPVGKSVHLRVPPELLARYAAEAGRRSTAAGRTITTQAVMLEVLANGLPDHG